MSGPRYAAAVPEGHFLASMDLFREHTVDGRCWCGAKRTQILESLAGQAADAWAASSYSGLAFFLGQDVEDALAAEMALDGWQRSKLLGVGAEIAVGDRTGGKLLGFPIIRGKPGERRLAESAARLAGSIDASRWADEFVRMHGGDEGLMLSWFANAIMAGFDEGERRSEGRSFRALRYPPPPPEPIPPLVDLRALETTCAAMRIDIEDATAEAMLLNNRYMESHLGLPSERAAAWRIVAGLGLEACSERERQRIARALEAAPWGRPAGDAMQYLAERHGAWDRLAEFFADGVKRWRG